MQCSQWLCGLWMVILASFELDKNNTSSLGWGLLWAFQDFCSLPVECRVYFVSVCLEGMSLGKIIYTTVNFQCPSIPNILSGVAECPQWKALMDEWPICPF